MNERGKVIFDDFVGSKRWKEFTVKLTMEEQNNGKENSENFMEMGYDGKDCLKAYSRARRVFNNDIPPRPDYPGVFKFAGQFRTRFSCGE
jgi:hypothetical protein